ncbi:MAG TPA: hypothetical protein PLV61_07570 [Parvularculaceae bacterium]|mgnify:CR=1 FL=1|nr:hypothetical protein [Amphiplicatus sp.]MCB9956899.1 hypothetical protein [Caulobacterales bacterium]HPE31038.1 hypothetical protein [Parvularculaceae bacterium]HRX39099.1 hypothetical protein [Parvularculaceae bacterium]
MADQSPLTPEKHERLLEFLGALPNAAALKLFTALERERAAGGRGLPYDALIEQLRDQLKARGAAFPSRPKNAQRLFFTPFEDFFISRRSGKKRRARIARTSLTPIWSLLMNDPACAGAARAAGALDQAIGAGRTDLIADEEALFNAAGQGLSRVIAHAEADERFYETLSAQLGGAGALSDLGEIHFLLSAVDHLKALQAVFPKPVGALTEEELYEARRIYEGARRVAPEAAPYLLLALAARMNEPWRSLRLYYHLASLISDASDPAAGDSALLVETLFEDLENDARRLERDAAGAFDAEDAAFRLSHFIDYADGLAGEASRADDNVVLNRIEACRDVAGDCLERFAEQSLAALRAATPVRKASGASRLMAYRPDISHSIPPRILAAAREAARFLAKSKGAAEKLGRASAAKNVIADASAELKRYLGDLVVEIRAAEGEERALARRIMENALDFAAPLLGDTEIAQFKERAKAAALTA